MIYKLNIDVLIRIGCNVAPSNQDDLIQLARNLEIMRRRIYVDDELMVERGVVNPCRIFEEHVNEEILIELASGFHYIILEPSPDVDQYIITNLHINDRLAEYSQDSFHQIAFNIE